jgi:rhodanese-related sulfurtransferase
MKTYQDLLADTKSRITEISVKDAFALRHTTGDVVFLDVRDPHEYNLGKIPGAVTISRGNLEKNVEAQVPREKSVVVYCANGNRSAFAADVLGVMGYQTVR